MRFAPEPPTLPTHDATEDFVACCAAGRVATWRKQGHQVDFLPAGTTLVVSFEPAATQKIAPELDRPAWGQPFVQRRGHSLLGVKRQSTNWYRCPDLHRLFRALQADGFFARFERVLFYGASMGGHAALALAAVAPGCTVLALSPQSTLAPDRVWFDQRFANARAAAWQGDFVDGVDGAATAARVYVCYDPYQLKDRLHVDRLPRGNLVRLRLPFVGHKTAQALQALGLMGRVFDDALANRLDAQAFRQIARERNRWADYHCLLAERGRWMPRRARHLALALAQDPQHVRANALKQTWFAQHPTERASSMRPARWPTGVVTAEHVPLVYLNIPKSASTTIQNHLLYIAHGQYAERPQNIHQHPGLRRGREDDEAAHRLIDRQLDLGAVVFTFVRNPGHRVYGCFASKIMCEGQHTLPAVRRALMRDWGLRLVPPQRESVPIDLLRENFVAFLRFVEANLAGDTELPRNPHWCPQGPMLVHYRKFLKIDVVGKVENFAADMALVLHRAGVRRIPDTRHRPWQRDRILPSFDEVITPDIQGRLDRLYEADYHYLGYDRLVRADGSNNTRLPPP